MNQKAYDLVKREAQIAINLAYALFDAYSGQALSLKIEPQEIYHRGSDGGPVGVTNGIEIQVYSSKQNNFVLRRLVDGRETEKYVLTFDSLTYQILDESVFEDGVLQGTHKLGVNTPDLNNLDIPLFNLTYFMASHIEKWQSIANPHHQNN